MDDINRKILLMIYGNPRLSIREIARGLGLSRQTVDLRMRALTKMGSFRRVRACLSVHYLNAFALMVWGRSRAASIEKALDRLSEGDLTNRAAVAGGKDVYVWGFLRKPSELDGYVNSVKQATEIAEPTVGIISHDRIGPDSHYGTRPIHRYKELSALDLKIIASLQDDARKPVAEIADTVGASARTVRRRLERMSSEGTLRYDLVYDLTSGEDIFTLVHVELRSGARRVEVGNRLFSHDPLHIVHIESFSNLPNLLLGFICSDKMTEIRRILNEIGEDEDVLAVTPNLIYLERMYWTWDEKMLGALARPAEKVGDHRLHS